MVAYIGLGISAVLIIIDQFIKQWALTVLSKTDTIPIIQDVLHLTYCENRGAAFSILQNQRWLLIGVTFIVLVILIIVLIKKYFTDKLAIFSIALIIGGGFGNLIDRFFRHFVIDFIDFRLINFAVFNFADMCVVCGTILFLIYYLIANKQSKPANSVPTPDKEASK